MEDPNRSSAADETLIPDPTQFGFERSEFRSETLAGTIGLYGRHVFLCYKSPKEWPSHVESAQIDSLPSILFTAIGRRKADMKTMTPLTICEGEDGSESSNGDLLIFPDMVRYRGLTHLDVDKFVEEVLVKGAEWLPGAAEPLTGTYVYVCAHGSRDTRCGVCGPPIIERFKDEIKARGLKGQVSVSPCTHIGGHKYAGNVIIYGRHANEVTGHWYGYVTPDDVPALLDQHIGKGKIVAHLWRGQMGVSKDKQKEMYDELVKREQEEIRNQASNVGGCCQGNGGNFVCCQSSAPREIQQNNGFADKGSDHTAGKKSSKEVNRESSHGWFAKWERADNFAAIALAAAVVSVAVSYGIYKNIK